MTTTSTARAATAGRLLNKVPEVTIWFWIIKILCTTVGESFADWINLTLGVGLGNTAWIFTGVLVVVLAVQLSLKRYSPFPYWLTVVVISITGTLYTDILTDQLGVPLWVSSAVFSVLLAAVFGIWWARERTLSIHSIDTRPREAFYWLTVLVTFALGTATGDWTLELTGWSPGVAVLLPLGLILAITALWRGGANPVLSFWLAYILTRPLGANIGDFLGSPTQAANPGEPVGLGLGTFATSIIFLGLILATVIYLAISRRDVVETYDATHVSRVFTSPQRERIGLIGFVALGVATAVILTVASLAPHQAAAAADDGASTGPVASLSPQQVTAHLPKEAVAKYIALAQTATKQDAAGDTSASHATVQKMRDAWDADANALQAADQTAWTFLDQQMDAILKTYAIDHPGVKAAAPAAQQAELATLLKDLGA
ncbi:COG4705 family protein [Microbacterium sp. 2MCAF23]|uniref:COG4705 family protein n=1 Tax=Microbacterium sp. 2MCAF23 TaxID=3232985 RepID=UPI003F9E45F1